MSGSNKSYETRLSMAEKDIQSILVTIGKQEGHLEAIDNWQSSREKNDISTINKIEKLDGVLEEHLRLHKSMSQNATGMKVAMISAIGITVASLITAVFNYLAIIAKTVNIP